MTTRGLAILGIDQTGAVDSKGRPRPLPACILDGNRFEFFQLKGFSKSDIRQFADPDIAILDCVLGLPKDLKLDWRTGLAELKSETRFGRAAAEEYFARIGRGKIWHREVELLAKANSLFRSRPFQKNIQTGTYRFWLEMAQDPDWFRVPWLHGEKPSGLPVYEGYPSLLWRRLLPTQTRKPSELQAWTEKKYRLKWKVEHTRLIEKDANFADALILALGGRELRSEARTVSANPEGWILGVPAHT